MKEISSKLESYDISGDTIFSEAIAATSTNSKSSVNEYGDLINRYYQESEENVVPINLI